MSFEYCGNSENSWATINDLYDRFGEEYVDKISIRRNYDPDLENYVADESKEGKTKVQLLALCDAMELLKSKLRNRYRGLAKLDTMYFYAVKQWHIKLTIQALKNGGDCASCECVAEICEEMKNPICNDTTCLEGTKTFISASVAKFDCDFKKCGC